MDRAEAARTLGVALDAERAEVRAAYLRLVRSTHPDVAGSAGDTAATARLTEAWAVLRAPGPPVEPAAGASAPDRTGAAPPADGGDAVVDDEVDAALAGGADADFLALLDAAHGLGEVSWADRNARLVQLIVLPEPDGPWCQLVAGLAHTTDGLAVRCAMESLENRPAPPLEPVAARLAALVAEATG